MMGAGKTTVGARVAEIARVPGFDLDDIIEATNGRTISTIFDMDGETAFRELEHQSLVAVLDTVNPPYVLSTGGGLPLHASNRQILREHFWVVWLDAPASVLLERALDIKRPLIREGPSAFFELKQSRDPLYRALAHKTLDVARQSSEEIAQIIATWWREVADG